MAIERSPEWEAAFAAYMATDPTDDDTVQRKPVSLELEAVDVAMIWVGLQEVLTNPHANADGKTMALWIMDYLEAIVERQVFDGQSEHPAE